MALPKPINGRTFTILIATLSLLVGIVTGSITAGAYLGGIKTTLQNHAAQGEIHQTLQQKEEATRMVVDREVHPTLEELKTGMLTLHEQNERVEARLIRIEERLNNQ